MIDLDGLPHRHHADQNTEELAKVFKAILAHTKHDLN